MCSREPRPLVYAARNGTIIASMTLAVPMPEFSQFVLRRAEIDELRVFRQFQACIKQLPA